MLKGQGHKARARGAQVLVITALGMDAIEAAHHITVHHVDHRLSHRLIDALTGQHAFLDQDILRPGGCLPRAQHGAEFGHAARIAHRGNAHATAAIVRLDHHKRLLLDAVFLVLSAHLGQQGFHLGAQVVQAARGAQVDRAAALKHGVYQPGVSAEQFAQALGHLFIALEMRALAPGRPGRMQGRQQVLLVQVLKNARHAGVEIGVEQNRAGIKVFHANAPFATNHGLQCHAVAIGQGHGDGFFDGRVNGADAHIEPGHVKNALQLHDVGQVEGALLMVFRYHQQIARLGADFFDGRHGGLHRQWQHLRRQVVPAPGEQIGVYRRQLEAAIAQIYRTVKGWRVLHPLKPEPALYGGHRIKHPLLEFIDGAGQGGD